MDHAGEWDGALLIETSDYCSKAIAKHKAMLSQHYKVVTADWEIIQIFLEKDRTYALAEQYGIPHPNVYNPHSMAELDAIANQLTFPVMIKPVSSHEFVRYFHKKLFIIETIADLRSLFQQTLDAHTAVMLSEIIPGTDYGTLERINVYVNAKGEFSAIYPTIKLRQTPSMFGVMRVGKTTSPHHDAEDYARQLLAAVNYRGYANVEFKRDPRDHQPKLIEVNVRVPSGIALPIASGADFPWMMYQDLVLEQPIEATQYRENTYLIDLVADLGNSLLREFTQTIKHFPRFLGPYLARHKIFAVWSWDDPQPFLYMFKNRLSKFGRKHKHVDGDNRSGQPVTAIRLPHRLGCGIL
jgi:D-aspartate ligase